MKVPPLAFFITKYFGSGVIIATAFIHVSGLFQSGWSAHARLVFEDDDPDLVIAARACKRCPYLTMLDWPDNNV
jgi:hypothetical protein